MKINGYTLRTAIRNRETERDTYIAGLAAALQGSGSSSPEELLEKVEKCEKAIAKLQAFQTEYNLTVSFKVGEEEISMAEAVKRIGGIERVSQHWRNLMSMKQLTGVAVSTKFNAEDAMTKAKKIAAEASTLRGYMSMANNTEIDIPELEENLVESK